MSKIVQFNSEKEFVVYREKKATFELGTGSEGTCYLGNDGLVYKDLTDGCFIDNYIPADVITNDEFQSENFAFPHLLFVVGNHLVGYKCDVVNPSLLSNQYIFFNGIDHIDFEKLYQAYEELHKEAIRLGENGISIFDLPFNLLFDGEKLIGIDTCGYFRTSPEECLENGSSVDEAVKHLFTQYARVVHKDELDLDMDVKSFLNMIESKYTSHNTNKKPYTKK